MQTCPRPLWTHQKPSIRRPPFLPYQTKQIVRKITRRRVFLQQRFRDRVVVVIPIEYVQRRIVGVFAEVFHEIFHFYFYFVAVVVFADFEEARAEVVEEEGFVGGPPR